VADGSSTLRWQKSSYTSVTGECVEVAVPGDEVWVRDSKNRRERPITVTRAAWCAFVTAVASGGSGGETTRPA
jgi:DNA-binding sugar fermentation-stimulating protein